MSEYGPAIFCRRTDGNALSEPEQDELLDLVSSACEALGITDDWEQRPVSPSKYDYDGYETSAVSFVLWANYAFGQAPDFIQDDFHKNAEGLSLKIKKVIEQSHPGVYEFQGYYVEV